MSDREDQLMTTNVTTAAATRPANDQQVAAAVAFPWRRLVLIILGVLVLFAATYLLAWWDANRLANRYMGDAEASYAADNYLEALVGYQAFDEAQEEYVQRGGYMQVERIWQDPHAWPVAATAAQAKVRIDEIINERLTVAQAEQFVQQNIGRANPYLGPIYLRLGELYEAAGDTRAAADVYEEVMDLFTGQPALAERAQANLARLTGE
jgi:tetratricopeptide (TPR) repeat protein